MIVDELLLPFDTADRAERLRGAWGPLRSAARRRRARATASADRPVGAQRRWSLRGSEAWPAAR